MLDSISDNLMPDVAGRRAWHLTIDPPAALLVLNLVPNSAESTDRSHGEHR